MRTPILPSILCVGEADTTQPILERAGFPVKRSGLSGIDPAVVAQCGLVILEPGLGQTAMAFALCRRWRIELGEHFVPILWITTDDDAAAAALEAGADACLVKPGEERLLAQIRALLRVQHLCGRLLARALETQQMNQRLQQVYQQMDTDLELVRRLHRGFLPRSLPQVGGVRFAVCYRPRSRVGGDFYDVLRVDEDHIVAYVADALGRGLPTSSLLSIFVKKCIQPKEITGRSYRLVPPGEVLSKINRELIALGMPESPYVSMAYLQVNCRDGAVAIARASMPPPLYIPAEGEPMYWHTPGTMLGVFEAEYPLLTRQLRPGDKLLLYSDGVQPTAERTGDTRADALHDIAAKHRGLPAEAFVDQVARESLEHAHSSDDFTLLVMEYT